MRNYLPGAQLDDICLLELSGAQYVHSFDDNLYLRFGVPLSDPGCKRMAAQILSVFRVATRKQP